MSPPPPRRTPRPVFRPRFTLSLLYLIAFFLLFGTLFALPDLLEAAGSLPPGPTRLTPEELEQAERVGRDALSRTQLAAALLAALAATALGARANLLPGLRNH